MRGLGAELTPEILKKSDKLLDRAMRMAFSLTSGPKVALIKAAANKLIEKSPTNVQGKLIGLAKEIKKGAPTPAYVPGLTAKTVDKLSAVKEGRQNQ